MGGSRATTRVCRVVTAGVGLVLLAACSDGPAPAPSSATSGTPSLPPSPSSPSSTSSPAPTDATPPATSTATSASATATGGPPASSSGCADRLARGLSPAQKAGQLIMVGAEGGQSTTAVDRVMQDQQVGAVILLGPWSGASTVSTAGQHWQGQARTASGGIGALLATDQEGGQVQRLTGAGFTSTPSALTQGSSPAEVARTATLVGGQLAAAGVTVDLAPVADTVSADFARQNAPIGAYDREFGHDPETVSAAVRAAVGSLQGAGVSATLKHFPGLGRVTGNTDLTATGTTDTVTTADDADLAPFRAGVEVGVEVGADLVMVSSALYPKIDPDHRAAFSRAVVTGVLRERLGFRGVVITDDVGAAKAVAAVPVGDRAAQFISAGGDIVLTALPSTVPAMAGAVVARAAADPAFASQVDAAVRRVLDLKVRRGLATCS